MLGLKGLLATTALAASLGCTTNVYAEPEVAGGGDGPPPPVVLINDTFDSNISGWTDDAQSTSSHVTTGGGRLRVYKTEYGLFSAYRSFSTQVGKFYKVEASIKAAWNPGSIVVSKGFASYNSGGELGRPVNNSSNSTGSIVFEGTGNTVYIHALNSIYTSTWIEVDNVKVTEFTPIQIFDYDFAENIDGWSAGTNATISWRSTGGGRIRVVSPSNAHGAYREFDTEVGKTYELTGSLVGRSAYAYMRRETAGGANIVTMIDSNASVTASDVFAGTGATMRVNLYTYGSNWCEFDNISLYDITTPA